MLNKHLCLSFNNREKFDILKEDSNYFMNRLSKKIILEKVKGWLDKFVNALVLDFVK